MNFIIVNGEIIKCPEDGYLPWFENDSFVVTQKIWFGFGGIPLFTENIENIAKILETFRATPPHFFSNKKELFRIIKRMLNKNKFYRSGLISFRLYIHNYKTDCIISSEAYQEMEFSVSSQGLLLNFSETVLYSGNPLCRFSFFHQPQWQVSEAEIQNTPWQNTIFLNEKGLVTHCIGANILGIKNKTLYIPSLETGRYTDTILTHIINASLQAGLEIAPQKMMQMKDLMMMKEIFLASESKGIQWVMGIENKRYVQSWPSVIQEKLNEILKAKVV